MTTIVFVLFLKLVVHCSTCSSPSENGWKHEKLRCSWRNSNQRLDDFIGGFAAESNASKMARDLAPHSKDGTEGPQMSKVRLAAAAVKLCKPCSKQAAAHAVARPSMPQQQLIAPVSDWNKAELVSDAACFWWLDSEQKWHHWRYVASTQN